MKDNHQKHLTLSDRIIIERGLNEGKTFASIATTVGKDPTTISKEIKKHRTLKQRKDKSVMPRCKHEKGCQVLFVVITKLESVEYCFIKFVLSFN